VDQYKRVPERAEHGPCVHSQKVDASVESRLDHVQPARGIIQLAFNNLQMLIIGCRVYGGTTPLLSYEV
jgi:hypothetical protein